MPLARYLNKIMGSPRQQEFRSPPEEKNSQAFPGKGKPPTEKIHSLKSTRIKMEKEILKKSASSLFKKRNRIFVCTQ